MQVAAIVAQSASSDTRERPVGGIGSDEGSRLFIDQFIAIKFTSPDNRAYLPRYRSRVCETDMSDLVEEGLDRRSSMSQLAEPPNFRRVLWPELGP